MKSVNIDAFRFYVPLAEGRFSFVLGGKMAGIEWENYKRKRLHEVWEDLPQGCRLRIAFFDGSIPMKDYCFSPALAPAHVLAYYNASC